jgi:hypothetical protein
MPCFAPTASSDAHAFGDDFAPMPSPGMTAIGALSCSPVIESGHAIRALETSTRVVLGRALARRRDRALERRAGNRHSELALPMLRVC